MLLDRRVGKRAQRTTGRWPGQLRTGVEGALTLPRAAPADQEPIAGQDDTLQEPARRAVDLLFILVDRLPALASRLADEFPSPHGTDRPGVGAFSQLLTAIVGFLCGILVAAVGRGTGAFLFLRLFVLSVLF